MSLNEIIYKSTTNSYIHRGKEFGASDYFFEFLVKIEFLLPFIKLFYFMLNVDFLH